MKHLVAALAVVFSVSVSFSQNNAPPPQPPPANPAVQAPAAPVQPTSPSEPLKKPEAPPVVKEEPPAETPTPAPKKKTFGQKRFKKMFAVFDTSMGKFKCRLFFDKAPKTVENFTGLAEGTRSWKDPSTGDKVTKPFYDGLVFHRVIRGFIVQAGDPMGTGRGGPGFNFADEIYPDLSFEKPGMLAMANAGKGTNTNGSQFFVNVEPHPELDKGYSIFGEVVSGLDVVKAISKVPTDPKNDKPLKPVTIKKVTIIRE